MRSVAHRRWLFHVPWAVCLYVPLGPPRPRAAERRAVAFFKLGPRRARGAGPPLAGFVALVCARAVLLVAMAGYACCGRRRKTLKSGLPYLDPRGCGKTGAFV